MTASLDRETHARGASSRRASTNGRPARGMKRRRDTGFFFALLSPTLLIVAATIILPLAMLVAISVREVGLAPLSSIFEAPLTLGNYSEVLQDSDTWRSLGTSLIYVFGTTFLALGMGMGLALILNGYLPVRRLFRTLLLIPWAIPGVTATIAFLWIMNPSFGVANYALRTLGIIDGDINWFGSPETAMLAVILPTAWKAYPFYTVMILAGMQSIPRELYEAAEVDGAGTMAKFRGVTWPGIKAYVAIAAVFNMMYAFREFDFIFSSTRGGPGGATETMAIRIYNEAFESFQFGSASALGVVVFVLLAIVVAILMRSKILTEGASS